MKLVDTSVWIEYLRGSDSDATAVLRRLAREELADVAICEPVAMELLAGAGEGAALSGLEQLVDGLPSLAVAPAEDFRAATAIYRAARRSGRTVRSLTDCLIAAVALRHGATLVHRDVDFDAIAAVTPLAVVRLT